MKRSSQYADVSVQVVATKPSLTFFSPEEIRKQGVNVWLDEDEWRVSLVSTCMDHPRGLANL